MSLGVHQIPKWGKCLVGYKSSSGKDNQDRTTVTEDCDEGVDSDCKEVIYLMPYLSMLAPILDDTTGNFGPKSNYDDNVYTSVGWVLRSVRKPWWLSR